MARSAQVSAVVWAGLAACAHAGTSSVVVDRSNAVLAGGATFISGHGAPTGMAIRSGSSGAETGKYNDRSALRRGSSWLY